MFKVECGDCGKTIVIEGRKGKCPHCGMVIEIVWPEPGKRLGETDYSLTSSDGRRIYKAPKPVTISEKYDEPGSDTEH